ncbi:tRNA lysidine(34) synthetase TilS [Ornithinicoccus halotolerans]|uniref:tRNA lysidine(34) synthetase TilS n=1 Tax=Ornithinicoccus halotolerans TaxID=1748220 RepID=UPI001296C8F5|nr:tRNA lysidine(34) synthetase TilS [Ornithinicoccus halotolerans]
MAGPAAAVADTRVAVRRSLVAAGVAQQPPPRLLVACSGGADSLALAAAVGFLTRRGDVRGSAVVVDHGLQEHSADVADRAAEACERCGLDPVLRSRVTVPATGEGPEAGARRARYEALEAAATRVAAVAVLTGHTRDDQAEQVLLGLARGSGARSLAGMPAARPLGAAGNGPLLLRPFLGLARETTEAACQEQELRPWQDPHNSDPAYARVRARRALTLLEEELGPGLRAALARSAALLAQDAATLEELAGRALADLGGPPWPVERLAELPAAVRGRFWRAGLTGAGVPASALSAVHLSAVEALVTDWHGQGPVALPGRWRASRRAAAVHLEVAPGTAG